MSYLKITNKGKMYTVLSAVTVYDTYCLYDSREAVDHLKVTLTNVLRIEQWVQYQTLSVCNKLYKDYVHCDQYKI